jgi:hypothetical protein
MANLTRTRIKAAVAAHDTPTLFGWLMDLISYQGVSDGALMPPRPRIALLGCVKSF